MKNLFKTKTFWTGAGSVVTGIGLLIIGNKVEGLNLIFSGFGMVFLRNAINRKNGLNG
jgi:hypothetical protein